MDDHKVSARRLAHRARMSRSAPRSACDLHGQLGLLRCACWALKMPARTAKALRHMGGCTLSAADRRTLDTIARRAAGLANHRHWTERRACQAHVAQSDPARSGFVATLLHELRSPLAPIRQAAQIVGSHPSGDPTLASCRDVIERQVQQMLRLLDDLQDFARYSRQSMDVLRDRLDLRLAVVQAVETVGPFVSEQRHRLVIRQPEHPVEVLGDLARLTQVFGNLLGNAAKYTPAGGHISVSVRQASRHAEVVVEDDGIGIEPAQLERVFDMFVQLAPALHRATGGQGIGLALIRLLVQQHGGQVSATSDGNGQGSRFIVQLPLAP